MRFNSDFIWLKLYQETVAFQTVEKLDLVGLDYLWRLVSESPSEPISDLAIDYLLSVSFTNVSPKLKADAARLHREFFSKCYARLDHILKSNGDDDKMNNSPEDALHDGFELETSAVEDDGAGAKVPKVLTEINIGAVMTMPPVAK